MFNAEDTLYSKIIYSSEKFGSTVTVQKLAFYAPNNLAFWHHIQSKQPFDPGTRMPLLSLPES